MEIEKKKKIIQRIELVARRSFADWRSALIESSRLDLLEKFSTITNMIINHFFVLQAHSQPNFLLFDFRMTQEISKGELGNRKQLDMANYIIYSKNNFNSLVMNITQKNFLSRQNLHI